MRVRRARTSWETSLMILALSLGERVVNHLARRWRVEGQWWARGGCGDDQGEHTTLPWRERRMRYLRRRSQRWWWRRRWRGAGGGAEYLIAMVSAAEW